LVYHQFLTVNQYDLTLITRIFKQNSFSSLLVIHIGHVLSYRLMKLYQIIASPISNEIILIHVVILACWQ